MSIKLSESWKNQLQGEFDKPYFKQLTDFVREQYQKEKVYPQPKNIFRAFDACPFEDVKVVILGQDPYHGPGQANGLCFAVHDGTDYPPSLRNIFKEMQEDLGAYPKSGELTHWAKQGVLLLNATLTVKAHSAGSHQRKGWEEFTDAAIKALAENREGLVFILWGSYAKKKGAHIDTKKHLVLTSAHPSPLSAYRGFFGSKPFSKANAYLELQGLKPIDWVN